MENSTQGKGRVVQVVYDEIHVIKCAKYLYIFNELSCSAFFSNKFVVVYFDDILIYYVDTRGAFDNDYTGVAINFTLI